MQLNAQFLSDAGAERTTELMGVGIDTAEIASTFSSFEVLYSRIGTEASSEPVKNCSHFEDGKSFAFENVFCHNDALSCNIMIPFDFFESSEEKNIVLIDYEYAGYGCRAFDIANHFCGKIGVIYILQCICIEYLCLLLLQSIVALISILKSFFLPPALGKTS